MATTPLIPKDATVTRIDAYRKLSEIEGILADIKIEIMNNPVSPSVEKSINNIKRAFEKITFNVMAMR